MMKIFRRRPLRKLKALCKGATWHTALRASPQLRMIVLMPRAGE